MSWFHAKVDVIQELQLGKKFENLFIKHIIVGNSKCYH